MVATVMRVACVLLVAALAGAAGSGQGQDRFGDAAVILEFQRAADAYAFRHRQTDRRGDAPASVVEGAFFTPRVSAAFRERIRVARTQPDCAVASDVRANQRVPGVNGPIDGTIPLPGCIAALLPRLAEELEFRTVGVVLVLVDAHQRRVLDVLHGAFPVRDN